jgi:2-hydroxychromene-2-carboxylate isomerase
MRAVWAEDADVADAATVRGLVAEALASTGAGETADDVLGRAESPGVKQALREATTAAATRGVFGVPTYIVGDVGAELYWGQDRLGLVEDALRGAARAGHGEHGRNAAGAGGSGEAPP